jgi:glycosyltransferase involved in cell wall biosynthesis
VYNVDPKWLDACIQSVRDQSYPHWELCLYDDASSSSETIDCLKKWEGVDHRIKIAYGTKNRHISGASNKALGLATGDFVALLDHDDVLTSDALFEVVKVLQKNPELDFIYSDEDKLDEQGNRVDPFFKPDWSLNLLLSMMYTCHLSVFRRALVSDIGGFREGFEGSQDYDFVLRFIEKTQDSRIAHIPKILYHWRKIAGSAAATTDAKSYAYQSAVTALQEYAVRNNLDAQLVFDTKNIGHYHMKYAIRNNPLVSVIIPFKDQKELLKTCVTSILKYTRYKNYEIILVNNQSGESATLYSNRLAEQYQHVRIISYDEPFNFADINNKAVTYAQGEYLIFLNSDTKIQQHDWIENMLEHAQRPSVGVVGCKLSATLIRLFNMQESLWG